MISLSYSRISLADIAQKLLLDSPEDAEYIVAKVQDFAFTSVKSHARSFNPNTIVHQAELLYAGMA